MLQGSEHLVAGFHDPEPRRGIISELNLRQMSRKDSKKLFRQREEKKRKFWSRLILSFPVMIQAL